LGLPPGPPSVSEGEVRTNDASDATEENPGSESVALLASERIFPLSEK
jgi:hypothetical protein